MKNPGEKPSRSTTRNTGSIQLLLTSCMGLLILLMTLQAHAQVHFANRHVLVIHSYHSGLSWTDSILSGIRDAFVLSGLNIDISAEYLDVRRQAGPEHSQRILELVISKLESASPNLVVVSDNAALDFVLSQRKQLLPATPIVFCGINDFKPSMISNYHQITGVAEDVSVIETLNLALRLQPKTREVIVVGRTSLPADRINRDSVVAALPQLPPQLQVTFWDDLPISELRTRLEKLKEGSILLLNGLITDQTGRQLMYGETARWICSHSPVPVYSLWDAYLGYGIVGGELVSGYRQGQLAGELAARILRGENADRVPVVSALHANHVMLDYQVLVRFGIALSGIPDDAILINRPDSFYDKYRFLVWAAAAAVFALSSLVVLLGAAMIHRRKAMEALSSSEEALRQANLVAESSPVVLFRWKATEGWPVAMVSKNVTQFGYTPEELLSGAVPFSVIIHHEDLERVASEVQHYSTSGIDQFQQEYRIVTKEGKVRWVEDHTIINRDTGGLIAGYQGIVIDITERRWAETALCQSEAQHRLMHETMMDGFAAIDLEGRLLDFNCIFVEMLGYTEEELRRLTYRDLTPERWHDFEAGILKREVFVRGYSEIYEKEYRRRGGSVFPVELRTYLIRDTVGRPTGYWAIVRDISERKRAEQALRQSEAVLRSLLEATPAGVGLLRDRIFVKVNAALCRITGYSENEMLGMATRILYPDDDEFIRIGKELYEQMDKTGLGMLESRLKRKDGEIIDVILCLSPFDPMDAAAGVTATVLDITERKRAEEENRRLRNYLGNIINSMPSMMVGVDLEGRVTMWNAAAEKVTGVKAEDAQGQPLDRLLLIPGNQSDRVRHAIQARTVEFAAKVSRIVDGGVRYEDVTVYPLISAGREGAVIRVDDVTERVQIEEMMVQSEKMLSVGGLAAGMAHEINNPLGVILQASQNVIRRLSPDLPVNSRVAGECGVALSSVRDYLERREILTFLEDIRQSGQRAAEIVTNMLSFSRKSEGWGSSTDLAELLDRTISLAASDYDLKKRYDFRQIEIVREYHPETPPVVCHASKIQQVFLNILRNGAEAMRSGLDSDRPPQFILRVLREDDMVRVEIQDNGPGMAEATRRRVFEPFFTTKPPGLGTGLGLSVSYFIVTEDHGGTLSVESSPGVGTRFIVRLPVTGKA